MTASRIAVAQLCSSANVTRNLQVVKDLIQRAIDADAKVIFFPEATDFISQGPQHSKLLANESLDFLNGITTMIKTTKTKIDVSIGVHLPPIKGEDRIQNALVYISADEGIKSIYKKIHMFDVDVPNGQSFKESNSTAPGRFIGDIINTPVGKLGPSICYDIRFPELALKLRSMGAEIICYPSAFTMKTGMAHWEILGRARAIDTQCYVVMPAQQGVHDTGAVANKRESWGHSMIIDPWGDIIARVDASVSDPQIICADLNMERLHQLRESMPLMKQRRKDIDFGL
ncbi:hypothetical protein NCAS_0A09720 [Naumovozyma castellii]|uniref:CN hydrolase domain-containing protein n=1 Tax=Naumovozyma castellii TaxID=27288 RepID=G0V7T2_NAUCA|nr:hypothetical protein NCAS_0A09720 [Naumovozyma castellii CBS 4309]CCC67530.1 hypothetical protein NCAS_0A09720 [Naumovozyma castellii CBS 4309]